MEYSGKVYFPKKNSLPSESCFFLVNLLLEFLESEFCFLQFCFRYKSVEWLYCVKYKIIMRATSSTCQLSNYHHFIYKGVFKQKFHSFFQQVAVRKKRQLWQQDAFAYLLLPVRRWRHQDTSTKTALSTRTTRTTKRTKRLRILS